MNCEENMNMCTLKVFDKNEIANREILIHKIDDDAFNPSGAAAQVRMND
jgi:hypothetical protein